MNIQSTGKASHIRSVVMYIVMAFSFCLFLYLSFHTVAPDMGFDNERVAVIGGDWLIEQGNEISRSSLPGAAALEKGKTIRYSVQLEDCGVRGNSIMFRSIHQYVRVYLEGELINDFGYRQKTIFGEAPYNAWVITRLPEDWEGKMLLIEETPYYDQYSGRLETVYIGTRNSLVFMVVHQSLPAVLFNFAIILAALLLLGFSVVFHKRYVTSQLRYLSIFSIVTCGWLILESGGYQILWGSAPLISNLLFLLFFLIPPTCIRFMLTYESFSKDVWLIRLYWLSIVNIVIVNLLQFAGIRDYIECLVGTHAIIILIMVDILAHYFFCKMRGEKPKDIPLIQACLTFSIFGIMDIVRFYMNGTAAGSSFFSQIGVVLFFIILIYYAVHGMLEEREADVKQTVLEHMAYIDLLTGLPNRNAFEKEMERLRGQNQKIAAVVVADLNDLKKINDTWGHQSGDKSLVIAANSLKTVYPECSGLYRIGGDEFCAILMEGTTQELKSMAELLDGEAARQAESEGLPFPISIAVGWAAGDERGIDIAFHKADMNMYEKKQQMKRKRLSARSEDPTESLTACGGISDETDE